MKYAEARRAFDECVLEHVSDEPKQIGSIAITMGVESRAVRQSIARLIDAGKVCHRDGGLCRGTMVAGEHPGNATP